MPALRLRKLEEGKSGSFLAHLYDWRRLYFVDWIDAFRLLDNHNDPFPVHCHYVSGQRYESVPGLQVHVVVWEERAGFEEVSKWGLLFGKIACLSPGRGRSIRTGRRPISVHQPQGAGLSRYPLYHSRNSACVTSRCFKILANLLGVTFLLGWWCTVKEFPFRLTPMIIGELSPRKIRPKCLSVDKSSL